MASELKLTVAFGDYEITRALSEGRVKPKGIELVADTRYGSRDRHWAMAKENAFDICEFNACAYFMARDRGYPWTALPVFCHRRFRHGFVFVNPASGIRTPKDLIGKRVGGTNFQPAGSVWIRGVLEEDYGVPHQSIHWFAERGEDIDFDPAPGLRLSRIREDQTLDAMILSGELDARIEPEFPQPFLDGDPRVVRLFPDYKKIEQDYYRRTGIFPIMHVTVLKREIVEKHPWAVASLVEAFEEAKAIAYRRVENPRVVPLAWFSAAFEEQRRLLGPDPWEYGLTPRNRANIAAAVRHTHRQGLTGRAWEVDELFSTP
jgi:4,5-dihydroxyphthalate decarboxylase